MAKDYMTASELNQLASSWGVVHIVSTLAIIGNVILNYKFKLKGKKQAIFRKRTMKINPRHFFRAWILLMREWN